MLNYAAGVMGQKKRSMARERLGYIDIKYIGIEKNVTMINMYIYIYFIFD